VIYSAARTALPRKALETGRDFGQNTLAGKA